MRILGLLLLSVFAVTSANAQDDVECSSPCLPRFHGSVDMISWSPHMRGLDFAASEDGTSLSIGSGQVHDLDLDRDIGMRTHLGFRATEHWSINFGYTHFGTEGTDTVLRPAGAGQLFPTVSYPGGPQDAEIASAFASFDYDAFDVVAAYPLVCRPAIGISVFGGLRWADINHELLTQLDGRDFVNGEILNQSDVNAFGLRFGSDCEWRLPHGWSVFGTTAVGALYGNIDNYRLETNNNGAQTLVSLTDAYEQPIFNIETALGASWNVAGVQLSFGYELNIWTNLGDSLRFVDDNESGGMTAMPGDLLLEGMFVRLSKSW